MRPSLKYIKEKFCYLNDLCFNGELPIPPIRLNTRYAQMGCTILKIAHLPDGTEKKDISIEISVRQDLPEEEYIDTIAHEMIHYYIIYKDLKDDSMHGALFLKMMHHITDTYGIRITVAFNPSEEYLMNRRSHWRYICVAERCDGSALMAVVAKNKVYELWDAFAQFEGVVSTEWYVSNRAIFTKFRVAVSPKMYNISTDKLRYYLTGAKELEKTEGKIRVKTD